MRHDFFFNSLLVFLCTFGSSIRPQSSAKMQPDGVCSHHYRYSTALSLPAFPPLKAKINTHKHMHYVFWEEPSEMRGEGDPLQSSSKTRSNATQAFSAVIHVTCIFIAALMDSKWAALVTYGWSCSPVTKNSGNKYSYCVCSILLFKKVQWC